MRPTNPLSGLTIGSTINATTGEFRPSIVQGHISVMDPEQEGQTSMSGTSSYVYSDSMNQGSLGISGSYGISGISKVKSSLDGYVGAAAAKSSTSIDVHYNVEVTAGVEYIDFDALQAADILTALKPGPRQSALASLEAYLALESELKALGCDLYAVVKHPDTYKKANDLFISLLAAIGRFTSAYGDGLIVGVTWGGFGTVTMNMSAATTGNTWQYGGTAAFSYSGIAGSISVEATYDGSQANRQGDVRVACTSIYTGACVAELVERWRAEVEGKSFSALAKVDVINELPPIAKNVKDAPAIPDFQTPPHEASTIDKIGQIKDLNGLQALAKAAAYEEAKKTNPSLELNQFLLDADKKANTKSLTDLELKIEKNDISVIPALKAAQGALFDSPVASTDGERVGGGAGLPGYVPLGIWIANWADIFPWLASGYCNNVHDNDVINEMLAHRMMMQDFQALAKMYYMAEYCKLQLFSTGAAQQIADSFAHNCGVLQETAGLAGMRDAFNGLSEPARNIYQKWDELKFLRDCELGLGVMLDDKVSIANGPPNPIPGSETVYYYSAPCDFRPGPYADYSSFASFMKVFPLIGPTGNLHAFGPANNVLSRTGAEDSRKGGYLFMFGRGSGKTNDGVMDLEANTTQKILQCTSWYSTDNSTLKFYPIPFKAAQRIQWKGESLSTNLSSMKGLNQQLKDVHKELSGLNAWTFSSEAWNKNWTPNTYYALRKIKTQYMGLIPEKPNIF